MRKLFIVAVSVIAFTVRPVQCAIQVEELCHLGGFEHSYSIAVDGNYAYWGTDKGLIILDVSQSSRPAQVGRIDLGANVTGIAVRNNLVYTADTYGLHIINVSNPARPQVTGQLQTSFGCDVKLDGEYAYIADGAECLRVIDVSNPNEPNLVASCKPDEEMIFAHHIAVSNGITYLTDEHFKKVYIIEVSQPNSPNLLTTYYSQDYAHGIAVRGNYAYLANGQAGLSILDISNPCEPNLLSVCDTHGEAYGVALNEGGVYVSDALSDDGDSGVMNFIDATVPDYPYLEYSYYTGSYAYRLAVQNNLVYIVNKERGFDIIDVSSPFEQFRAGHFARIENAHHVSFDGNRTCLTDGYSGVHFFDMSDPARPACLGSFRPVGFPWDEETGKMAVMGGNTAYYVDYYENIWSMDITNSYDPGGDCYPQYFTGEIEDLFLEGNLLYVAASSDGLALIDYSNLWWGEYTTLYNTSGETLGLVKKGNIVYVADGSQGLQIIEVSNPSECFLLGTCDTNGWANAVDIKGSAAVIADYIGGVKIIDVCDPCNPSIIGSCAIPGYAMDVAITGSFACVAGADSGLQIVCLANPAELNISASYDTPGSTRCVSTVGKTVVLADEAGGFFIFRIGLPGDLEPDGDVDTEDMMIFCRQWLRNDCEKPWGCSGADISNDGLVDFYDYVLFASDWQPPY